MNKILKKILGHSPSKPYDDDWYDGSTSPSVSLSASISPSPSPGETLEYPAHERNKWVKVYETPVMVMPEHVVKFIVCEYCRQRNLPLNLYCQQCGAPI